MFVSFKSMLPLNILYVLARIDAPIPKVFEINISRYLVLPPLIQFIPSKLYCKVAVPLIALPFNQYVVFADIAYLVEIEYCVELFVSLPTNQYK